MSRLPVIQFRRDKMLLFEGEYLNGRISFSFLEPLKEVAVEVIKAVVEKMENIGENEKRGNCAVKIYFDEEKEEIEIKAMGGHKAVASFLLDVLNAVKKKGDTKKLRGDYAQKYLKFQKELFEKSIAQKTIIEKEEIEAEILKFI